MTATLQTFTVEAAKVQPGDVINGRTVRVVHSKPQSATTRNQSNGGQGSLPNLTFSIHVVTVLFEDWGVPMVRWPHKPVEVQRAA